MAKTLNNHQTWRAEVIELRLMNEEHLYREAYDIAIQVLEAEHDDAAALTRIAKRLGGTVRRASSLESNRIEASVTLAAVRHEVAAYFVAERANMIEAAR